MLYEVITDMPEIIEFTTPFAGEAYRSGHELDVRWSVHNPDSAEIQYTLSFYDGEQWKTAGEGLSAEEASVITSYSIHYTKLYE